MAQERAMGGQPLKHEVTDLVPYRRGVSLREIAKGALVRFLPGSLIGLGGLTMVFDLSMRGDAASSLVSWLPSRCSSLRQWGSA